MTVTEEGDLGVERAREGECGGSDDVEIDVCTVES